MQDINFIRENTEALKTAIKNKNIKLDLDELLSVDEKRRAIQKDLNDLQEEKNKLAKAASGGKPTEEQISAGRAVKEKIAKKEEEFKKINEEFDELMVLVPVIPSKDTPKGKDERENVEVFRSAEPPKFDFEPKDYMTLAEDLDLIDFSRGVKVAGYRGYYLKNEAVLLQMGLMMFALKKLIAKGFTPIIPPTLIREFALFGSGYFEGRKFNPKTDNIYKIENFDENADGTPDKENKFLIGTAEPALLAYYAGEVLNEKDLPLKLCGFSQCYRSEIGSYGRDTKGIYRVHEFMKVEQVCITPADAPLSDKMHQEMLAISKELHEDLGLPYRQLQICTGDMSPGKFKMFDLEAWIPSRDGWGETGSASNFLDWQSRRLNVRYKGKDGKKKFVYMLNNTALPSARILIALLENHQQADGTIKVPEPLKDYIGKEYIGK